MQTSSRIDFTFTRHYWVDGPAKQVQYLWDCPLVSSHTGHAPMLAHLPLQWTSSRQPAQVRCGYSQRLAGRAAWTTATDTWAQFHSQSTQCIEQFFQRSNPSTSLDSLHSSLLSLFCSSFPSNSHSGPLDHVGTSLIAIKWKHRLLSRTQSTTALRNIFMKWFHWSRFSTLDRQHRTHARHLRRQRVIDLTHEAQEAHERH